MRGNSQVRFLGGLERATAQVHPVSLKRAMLIKPRIIVNLAVAVILVM
jgi:hypothetical protein